MSNEMIFDGEKERFDITVTEGDSTYEFTFQETYTEPPRIIFEGPVAKGLTSYDVTTTKVTVILKDTAGYTGNAIVIKQRS